MDERPMADRRNWWDRNWKWFVPTGCLTVLVLFAGAILSIVMLAMGMMKQSEAYAGAMRAARAHPALEAAIGAPLEEGRWFSGNFEETGPSGKASIAIPLTGPRGAATIYVEATKSAGQWHYDVLVAQVEASGERIDLQAPPPVPDVEQ